MKNVSAVLIYIMPRLTPTQLATQWLEKIQNNKVTVQARGGCLKLFVVLLENESGRQFSLYTSREGA